MCSGLQTEICIASLMSMNGVFYTLRFPGRQRSKISWSLTPQRARRPLLKSRGPQDPFRHRALARGRTHRYA